MRDVYRLFGRGVATDVTFEAHLLVEEDFDSAGCSPHATGGCARDGTAYVFHDDALRHELGHLLHHDLSGNSHRALNEGLAEALNAGAASSSVREGFHLPLDQTFDGLRTQDDLDGHLRASAELFTYYFLDAYSPEDFLAVFDRVPREASLSEIDDAMAEALGESFEVVNDGWMAAPTCSRDLTPCIDVDAPLLSPPFSVSSSARCEDDDAYGFDGPMGWFGPMHIYELHVPVDTQTYHITVDGADVAGRICDVRCTDMLGTWGSGFYGFDVRSGGRSVLPLNPGIYRVEVHPETEGGSYTFSMQTSDG